MRPAQERIAKKHWHEFLSDVGLLEYQVKDIVLPQSTAYTFPALLFRPLPHTLQSAYLSLALFIWQGLLANHSIGSFNEAFMWSVPRGR